MAGSAADKINALTALQTLGVSLVHRGANKRRFAIEKSETTEGADMGDTDKLMTSIIKDGEYDGEKRVLLLLEKQELDEKAMAAVKNALRMLNAFRDNPKVAEYADGLAQLVGYPKPKSVDEAGYPAPKTAAAKPDMEQDKKMPVAMAKALEGATPETRELMAAGLEEIAKSANEQVQKANEQVVVVQKALEVERDARLTREFVAKAQAEFPSLPGKPEELGLVLKRLHAAAGDALAGEVEAVLKAANEAVIKSGVLSEMGRSGESLGEVNTWTQMQSEAAKTAKNA